MRNSYTNQNMHINYHFSVFLSALCQIPRIMVIFGEIDVPRLIIPKSGSLSTAPTTSRYVDIEIINNIKKRLGSCRVILVERWGILVLFRQKSPVAFSGLYLGPEIWREKYVL